MERQVALSLVKKLGISIDRIVQEEYEILLLQSIFASNFSRNLVFRGGTALRLAYKSPRCSDDIDFSVLARINKKIFQEWCVFTARNVPNLSLVDARQKYFTLFALFKVADPALPRAFSIKVEISTRKSEPWKKNRDYALMNVGSEVTPIVVTAQVATVEKIEKEKKSISPLRIRDAFDLWFIGQKLGKNVAMDFSGFSKEEVRAELHKYLSQGNRRLITKWIPEK